MKTLIAAALALACSSALAEPKFDNGVVSVRLHESACAVPEIELVLGTMTTTPAKSATVVFNGKTLRACWAPHGARILVMDEDGDGGAIPASAFSE